MKSLDFILFLWIIYHKLALERTSTSIQNYEAKDENNCHFLLIRNFSGYFDSLFVLWMLTIILLYVETENKCSIYSIRMNETRWNQANKFIGKFNEKFKKRKEKIPYKNCVHTLFTLNLFIFYFHTFVLFLNFFLVKRLVERYIYYSEKIEIPFQKVKKYCTFSALIRNIFIQTIQEK